MKVIVLIGALFMWTMGLCAQSFQNSYGLVVGIHQYQSGGTLPNARADAEAIANLLKVEGYIVTELYDNQATRGAIIDSMDKIAQKTTSHDRVVFFFAGHGATLVRGGKDWGYVVPYDGNGDQASTLVSVTELQAESERMGNARHQLFLMDSCYGGSIGVRDIPGGGVPINAPDYLQQISDRIARDALTAGGKDQRVEDGAKGNHSIFTTALLEGIEQGKADADGDGIVTFPELTAYVLTRATTRLQTPVATQLPGDGLGAYWFRSLVGARVIKPTPRPAGVSRNTASEERSLNATVPAYNSAGVVLPVNMGPADHAEIRASGRWATNPPTTQGAGGLLNHPAPYYDIKPGPGANEGCLLVEIRRPNGDTQSLAFTKDDEILQVEGPISTMTFVANDDRNPQPPGQGFRDNSGSLNVVVRILQQ